MVYRILQWRSREAENLHLFGKECRKPRHKGWMEVVKEDMGGQPNKQVQCLKDLMVNEKADRDRQGARSAAI